jgi:hypothetical protein
MLVDMQLPATVYIVVAAYMSTYKSQLSVATYKYNCDLGSHLVIFRSNRDFEKICGKGCRGE